MKRQHLYLMGLFFFLTGLTEAQTQKNDPIVHLEILSAGSSVDSEAGGSASNSVGQFMYEYYCSYTGSVQQGVQQSDGGTMFSFAWTGEESTDWHNDKNWIENNMPEGGYRAFILATATHFPEIKASLELATLSIEPNALFTMSGYLDNPNNNQNNKDATVLAIISCEEGTDSILHFHPGLEATVEYLFKSEEHA